MLVFTVFKPFSDGLVIITNHLCGRLIDIIHTYIHTYTHTHIHTSYIRRYAAATSRSAGDHVPEFSFLELSYSRKPFDSEHNDESKRSSRHEQELTFLTYAYDLKCFVLYVTRNGHMELFRTNWGHKNGTKNY